MKLRVNDFFQSLKAIGMAFVNDGCLNRAGSLAYTTLLALVPLLTLVLIIAMHFPSMQALETRVEDFAFNYLIAGSNQVIHRYSREFALHAVQLSWIGLIALFVTVISLLLSIESTFNDICKLSLQKTRYLKSIVRHGIFIVLLPLLIGGALLLTSYLFSLSLLKDAMLYVDSFHIALSWLPHVFIFILIICLYKFMPATRTSFLPVLGGALFTTIIFILSKNLFKWYVNLFPGYKILYGAFAAIPIFLLWLYISWVIILLGFQIARYLHLKKIGSLNLPSVSAVPAKGSGNCFIVIKKTQRPT